MLDRGLLTDDTHAALAPPRFDTVDEERAHRQSRLVGAYRIFARFGYDHWVAGHITVRDPEHEDRFWANPLGVSWHQIRVSDLLLVDFDGNVLVGDRPLNAAAFAIHSQLHRARDDIAAVAHAHTVYGRAWSTTGRPLEALSQDHCAFYEDHAVFDDYTGAVYDPTEAMRFATAIGTRKAMILKHHGLLTVGESVDEAAFWLHLLERCCQTQVLVSSFQAPAGGRAYDVLPPDVARSTHGQVGEPLHGWRGFQPLWDELVAEHPDLPA
jgi:ribulose-5-phosphate 4-epimerase/fuculose-1-phosphate aldolase